MNNNFLAILMTLLVFTACRAGDNLSNFAEDPINKALRVAVASKDGKTFSVMVASNNEETIGEQVYYCLGTSCKDSSQDWATLTPVPDRVGFFTMPELELKDQIINLKLVPSIGEGATRSFKITDKSSEDSQPDQNQPQPETACHKADKFTCDVELAIHKYTNAYRTRHQVSATTFNANLGFVSRDWSKQQAARRSIGHQGFPSARRTAYRTEFGSEFQFMSGENVAYSSGLNNRSADSIGKYFADMWYNSPGHKANMLSRNQKSHGPGVHINGGTVYATQIFGSR